MIVRKPSVPKYLDTPSTEAGTTPFEPKNVSPWVFQSGGLARDPSATEMRMAASPTAAARKERLV